MQWTWKNFKSIKEAINAKTGGLADSFLNADTKEVAIQNADVMAVWLQYYAQKNIPITIIGDYDADGVCASAEMWMLLSALGASKIRVRLPRRFSEGYGLSPKIVGEIEKGVIVTVDNGIAALEAVSDAKAKGLVVLVIDHHLPKKENGKVVLPPADLIVDPHVEDALIAHGRETRTGFRDYCGAGLVCKIAGMILGKDNDTYHKITSLAAIATVADVVPLVGDNRNIYHAGIKAMECREMTEGLAAIVDTLRTDGIVSEGDIGFRIAPMLNAPGRLKDDGAMEAFYAVMAETQTQAAISADELKTVNGQRKLLRDEAVSRAVEKIESGKLYSRNPIVIYDPEVSDGIVGLVAGEIQEKYGASVFVFTKNGDNLKGSARGKSGDDVKASLDAFADKFPDILIAYGGHEGAAGVTMRKDGLDVFQKEMDKIMPDAEGIPDHIDYDLEIRPEEIFQMTEELRKYAPFGQGNPDLVFRINHFQLIPKGNAFYSVMGKDSVRFYGVDTEVIGFSMLDRYLAYGCPKEIDLVGKLSFHHFMGRKTAQVEMLDFLPSRQSAVKSLSINQSIANALSMI